MARLSFDLGTPATEDMIAFRHFQPPLYLTGWTVVGLAGTMQVPALLELATGSPEWAVFVTSGAISGGIGLSLVLLTRSRFERLDLRQIYLFAGLSWLLLPLIGALPFLLRPDGYGVTDAVFESLSGLTTAGATVSRTLDQMPAGILLWRALLNWIGGIAAVAMAVAVLPYLRIGGFQLFRLDVSDKSERALAQSRDLVTATLSIYVGLTLFSVVLFGLSGLNTFDAFCHAMAAVSTGGFSTRDLSIGAFPGLAPSWAAVASMLAGALPLAYYARVLREGRSGLRDSQVMTLVAVLAAAILAMTVWTIAVVGLPPVVALTQSALNVTSIVTATGFFSTDFTAWGSFALTAFFCFYFIGGCAGSTSGSIKIFRWQVVFLAFRRQMSRQIEPHRVTLMIHNGRAIGPEIVASVLGFVMAYVLLFVAMTLAVAATGVEFVTASSAVAATMAGAGPGLGPVIGPTGTYAPLPDVTKWLLCLSMLIGRLEAFLLLAVFMPTFWRD